jgi:hypothetical protein
MGGHKGYKNYDDWYDNGPGSESFKRSCRTKPLKDFPNLTLPVCRMSTANLRKLRDSGLEAQKELEKRAFENWKDSHTASQNAQSKRLEKGYRHEPSNT